MLIEATPPDPDASVSATSPEDVTRLLNSAAAGDPNAPGKVLDLIYEHLRAIARQRMAGEDRGHTLQATALVHEAYIRLLGKPDVQWAGRAHFFRAAADAMRKILIDYARARNADKRGGGRAALSLSGMADLASDTDPRGFLALDDAILRLERVDDLAAAIVRLRFYGGMHESEVAEALGISERSVRRGWVFARGWLRDALERDES